jgi:hypothetical protein
MTNNLVQVRSIGTQNITLEAVVNHATAHVLIRKQPNKATGRFRFLSR